MGQEGYVTSMHAAEDLTDGDFLTEAVKKYAERATQAEERMAKMEAKFKEKLSMMTMQKPPPPPCYQQPLTHTAYLTQQQQPPSTINIPSPQPQHQQQAYQPTARKRDKSGRDPCSATGGNQV